MDDQFRAIFSLVDQVSAPIMAIAARVEAANTAIEGSARRMSQAFAPLRDIQTSFGLLHGQVQRLAGNAGLPRIAEAFGTLFNRTRGLGQHIAGALGPLAGLGTLASAGGLAAAMHSAAETGGALNDLWNRLGVTTGAQRAALADLRYSATQTGASAEDVAGSMTRLNRVLGEAAHGRNEDALKLFQALGINVRNARGEIINAAEVIPTLARAMERIQDAGTKEEVARILMGKGGGALIPALQEFNENATRRQRFGSVFTPEQVQQLDAFGDAWADLGMAVRGVSNAIGAQLAPVLTPLLKDLALWVARIRPDVVEAVGTFIGDLAARLRAVNWGQFWARANEAFEGFNRWVDRIGGWEVVVGGFAAVMAGPLLAAIAGVGVAIAALGTAIVANPVGALIVAATAGVAFAAKAIYDNWEGIGAWFERQIAPLRDAIASLLEWWDRLTARVGNRPNEPTTPRANRNTVNGARRIEGFEDSADREGTLARAGALGQATIRVEFVNAPPGARVAATTTGPGLAAPQLNVGYAMGLP